MKKKREILHTEGVIEKIPVLLIKVENVRSFFGFSKSQLESQLSRKRNKGFVCVYINNERFLVIKPDTFGALLKMYRRKHKL